MNQPDRSNLASALVQVVVHEAHSILSLAETSQGFVNRLGSKRQSCRRDALVGAVHGLQEAEAPSGGRSIGKKPLGTVRQGAFALTIYLSASLA